MTNETSKDEQTVEEASQLTDTRAAEQGMLNRRDVLKGIGAASASAVTVGVIPSSVAAADLPTSSPQEPTWAVGKHNKNQKRGATAYNYELGAILQYNDYESSTNEHKFSLSWAGFCSTRSDRTVKGSNIGGQFLHIDTPSNVNHSGPQGNSNKKGIGPVDRESEYSPGFGPILGKAVGLSALPPGQAAGGAAIPAWLMAGSDIVKNHLFLEGGERSDGFWIHESYTDASQYEIIHGERVAQAWGLYKDFRLKDPSPNDNDQPVVRIAVGEGEFGGTGELVSEPGVDYARQYLEKQALTDSVQYQGDKGAGVEFKLHLDGSNGVRVESPVYKPIYNFGSTAAEYDTNTNGRIESSELDQAEQDWNNGDITDAEYNNVIRAYNRTVERS
ncbi:twin-arginine translocation signal domain-containing protein [Haloarcula argentinensis]|nr:twin-arginine translocation signal domain-containing protein [Haloarcula argentinensis]